MTYNIYKTETGTLTFETTPQLYCTITCVSDKVAHDMLVKLQSIFDNIHKNNL